MSGTKIKLEDLKPGDTVIADSGFTCLRPGEHKILEQNGELAIVCDKGFHYLNGQKGRDGYLIGLVKKLDL